MFVIGGAQIYRQALPLADELLLTEIDLEVEGDAFFPEFGQGRVRREVARAARRRGRHPVRVRRLPQARGLAMSTPNANRDELESALGLPPWAHRE